MIIPFLLITIGRGSFAFTDNNSICPEASASELERLLPATISGPGTAGSSKAVRKIMSNETASSFIGQPATTLLKASIALAK